MSFLTEFDFEFTKGKRHYYSGAKKEDLLNSTPASRAGFETAKFQHLKKINKAESN